ncbi:MAG: hypothetical protein IKV63_01700 [Clostridia bacterium]|nr:hypothetical protein [Clostridia bacterium]
MKKIVIIGTMVSEIANLLEKMSEILEKSHLNFTLKRTKLGDKKVISIGFSDIMNSNLPKIMEMI